MPEASGSRFVLSFKGPDGGKTKKKTISMILCRIYKERGALIIEGVQIIQGPHGMVDTVIGGWNEGGYVLLTTDRNGWR